MSGLRSQTFRIKRGADGFKRSGDKLGVYVPPAPGEYAHGGLFTFSAVGLPLKVDRNHRNFSWQGSRFLVTTFSDLAAGKPELNTIDGFRAALNGFYPSAAGNFKSDWETFDAPGVRHKGMKIRSGGPSRSGKYMTRGWAEDGDAVYGWCFTAPPIAEHCPIYKTFKIRHAIDLAADGYNPNKIFRMYFIPPDGIGVSNVYLNQSGSGIGWGKFRSHHEYPSSGSLYYSNEGDLAPHGDWHRVEVIGDNLTHEVRFRVNGVLLENVTKPGVQTPYYEGEAPNGQRIMFPDTFNQLGGFADPAVYPPGEVGYTDLYIDYDRHRVELSNSPIWGQHTHSEIQIPVLCEVNPETDEVTWGIRLNQGEHADLSGLSVHLVDNFTNLAVYSEELP